MNFIFKLESIETTQKTNKLKNKRNKKKNRGQSHQTLQRNKIKETSPFNLKRSAPESHSSAHKDHSLYIINIVIIAEMVEQQQIDHISDIKIASFIIMKIILVIYIMWGWDGKICNMRVLFLRMISFTLSEASLKIHPKLPLLFHRNPHPDRKKS